MSALPPILWRRPAWIGSNRQEKNYGGLQAAIDGIAASLDSAALKDDQIKSAECSSQ
jgi:hypothetical protein